MILTDGICIGYIMGGIFSHERALEGIDFGDEYNQILREAGTDIQLAGPVFREEFERRNFDRNLVHELVLSIECRANLARIIAWTKGAVIGGTTGLGVGYLVEQHFEGDNRAYVLVTIIAVVTLALQRERANRLYSQGVVYATVMASLCECLITEGETLRKCEILFKSMLAVATTQLLFCVFTMDV